MQPPRSHCAPHARTAPREPQRTRTAAQAAATGRHRAHARRTANRTHRARPPRAAASSTSTKAVIVVIALHGRTAANGDHPRGLRAAGMWPASAKTSAAVVGGHGVPAGRVLRCDTNSRLFRLTQPARSRARPAREYASKTGHTKTKHRARARWVGVLISHRSTDRPPSFPLAHLRRRKARRANKPKPTPQPISTPPVPLKTPRHRHPCAREHVHSGRARSVAPRLSSFRRRDSNRCHVIIIFVCSRKLFRVIVRSRLAKVNAPLYNCIALKYRAVQTHQSRRRSQFRRRRCR